MQHLSDERGTAHANSPPSITASSATALSRDDEAVRLDTMERGMRLHAHARAVLSDCAGPLAREWLMSAGQIQKVLEAFGSVVGGFRQASSPAPAPVPTSPPRMLVEDYGQTVHLFLAAVAQGMADALAAFAQVSSGHFSHDAHLLASLSDHNKGRLTASALGASRPGFVLMQAFALY
jgi:hypothetical protein